ncbi:capsule assembly Wzi family protein [Thalassobius sp. Cn5-15]|uniref:capsule assembly Wzi family protein n=1 Tax=Thalassobius sp. Cn5-15 TaxID=2917763 RepID=UPI001EF20F06|nr:capsule assembly Wzi family protein [Thalassobius sp. Cn5-15]MCG7494989.1 capsule assembly Wzi family protein [Thalassobius sp. Cn5-15]
MHPLPRRQRSKSTAAFTSSLLSATLLSSGMTLAEPASGTLTLGTISEDFLTRSERFGTLGFNGAAISGRIDYGNLSASATLGQTQHDQASGDFDALINYDVSLRFAQNWRAGVGRVDRNWSPSQYSSLILSQNAPAFDSVYLIKDRPSSIDLPVLRWLGDWDGEVFIGTTNDAGQPDNALIMGMRARIRPIENLEVDFVRTAQFGGEGQPQDFETLLRVLGGSTNSGAASGANQMAGIGLSYSLPNLGGGSRIYYQFVGEDEAGYFPSCLMHMGGVETNTTLFGSRSQITLEHTDTTIAATDGGFCGANTAYRNGTYSYANNGVVLGSAIDTQSKATTLYMKHELDETSVNWSIGHYTINDQSLATHRLSTARATGFVATASLSRPLLGGTVSALIAHQDFDLNTAGFDKGTRVGVSFQTSF